MPKQMTRRDIYRLALLAPAAALAAYAIPGFAQETQLPPNLDVLFGTPDTPTFGGPDTNVTMVAFLDYNCPFCKRSAPHLKALRESDPKLKVMYKDWPILTAASVYGGQAALAAHRNGQYLDAHDALMGIEGMRIPEEQMREALLASPVDMDAVDATIESDGEALLDQLRRNLAEAEQVGITGTPAYFIGPYFINGALDLDQFREAVAAARTELGV
ncbi:DsbA family protein [Pelagibacterium sp. 26DY04]|uniref:DsbA family protein n=1 Tax=Pelagibacterium sp. 26DY04 TaxID=2967130 RepID=UPI0028163116|nr:DsbA family protein [Pelagibacterium sp. 26DY04]WMT86203.1 DsbA family protein [Pelagibacterium sp. 26DY04]